MLRKTDCEPYEKLLCLEDVWKLNTASAFEEKRGLHCIKNTAFLFHPFHSGVEHSREHCWEAVGHTHRAHTLEQFYLRSIQDITNG